MASTQPKPAPGPAQGFRKLLVVVDGSDPALRVVDVGAEMAARYGAALLVLLLVELSAPIDPEIDAEATVLQAAADREREDRCRWIVEAAMSHGVDPEVHILAGPSIHSVATFAADHEIDLLVISGLNHGSLFEAVYSAFREALLGSRADAIIHRAPCTVMVVR